MSYYVVVGSIYVAVFVGVKLLTHYTLAQALIGTMFGLFVVGLAAYGITQLVLHLKRHEKRPLLEAGTIFLISVAGMIGLGAAIWGLSWVIGCTPDEIMVIFMCALISIISVQGLVNWIKRGVNNPHLRGEGLRRPCSQAGNHSRG